MHHRRGVIGTVCGAVAAVWFASAGAQPSADEHIPLQVKIEQLAEALRDLPRLKGLSEQQRRDRVEFVMGNTLFALLHEMGHVHIGELNLPVLSREEDEADAFAALHLIDIGTDFTQHVVANAAKGWFLSDRRDQQSGSKPLYYDDHELSQQRAYQFMCFLVGMDPVKFKHLADDVKMPLERQKTCAEDFGKLKSSWDNVLKAHRRAPDQPEAEISVTYEDQKGPFETLSRSFREIGLLERVAARARRDFVWPRPFGLAMKSCGRPGSNWDDKTSILTICYELAYDFAELYRAYVPISPAPAAATPPARTKKRS
jgi:hypothetical protein